MINEPRHNKTNIVLTNPITKRETDSEQPDQTARMRIHAGHKRTMLVLLFSWRGSNIITAL
jgi:hypothetical protein